MNHSVFVKDVDCAPEFDIRGDPSQQTRTFIRVDTDERTCRVYQEQSRYELTQAEFNKVIVVHPLDCRPDGDALEAWLEGDDGQELLSDICGWRTEAGLKELLGRLDTAVAQLVEDDTALWDAWAWYDGGDGPPPVTASMTDENVAQLAREQYEVSLADGATIPNIQAYLIEFRDKLRLQEQNERPESDNDEAGLEV